METVTINELSPTEKEILSAAESAKQNAYCPYSHFSVGAALLCADGQIITGVNVENISYGLTNCAERSAIFSAYSQGLRDFKLLAIIASSKDNAFKEVVTPCGACRQVIAETIKDIPIILSNATKDKIWRTKISELLPDSFDM
ncbi:MAG: cytidine deaminase [Verrucomicrobia bacterium CG_4_10_14_3_um_filter_43_23]|nr:MAG: cytidine deaminase [Verrucomicrobia bacterium CG1_02_43_26]PIP58672.1 MAG: cytidine deaminase [Verrucomicrobia bacterium CG22_combo_CG10-13_8_21_14_all_43_17]PIX58073.1 MAG: cytidine deaminase [Verrucomicrobia bacterium CG_4_10_14_3_um_filter_43_23]PIY61168.1 MAG: cytidine deaminase [Verrucomicrobia bacterium CG_4_10_14_0_8_um_filter_43_34]PJA43341.1 MAG: cytidine deaminase [Verrucomicrobia bacterium CG_4_9_14_3_um_filter_43_20]